MTRRPRTSPLFPSAPLFHSIAFPPAPSCFPVSPPLGARHRLERTAEGESPPAFHFHESDERTSPGNEVDLDASNAEAMRDDFPASRLQVTDRLRFGGQAALMARVRPIPWITANAARHSSKLATGSQRP